MLTTHRTTGTDLASVDLSAALDAERAVAATAATTVTFEARIPDDAYVAADEFLSTVLGIVLDNAVEHGTTPEDGSTVVVTVTETEADRSRHTPRPRRPDLPIPLIASIAPTLPAPSS